MHKVAYLIGQKPKEPEMKTEAKGVIGNSKGMLPEKDMVVRKRNGKDVKVPFMRFKMWADDETQAMVTREDGSKFRPRIILQVILPEDERGEKLFEKLYGGRRVLVRGKLTHRPNSDTDRDGNQILYANPVCYLENLEFCDDNPEVIGNRFIQVMQEYNVINDEMAERMHNTFQEHLAALRVNNENRGNKAKEKAELKDSDPPISPSDNPEGIGFDD